MAPAGTALLVVVCLVVVLIALVVETVVAISGVQLVNITLSINMARFPVGKLSRARALNRRNSGRQAINAMKARSGRYIARRSTRPAARSVTSGKFPALVVGKAAFKRGRRYVSEYKNWDSKTPSYGSWSLPKWRKSGIPHYGPGTRVRPMPYSQRDAPYWRHDTAYKSYVSQGVKPYRVYSKADEDLLREMRGKRGRFGYLPGPESFAYNTMRLKRRFQPRYNASWDPSGPPGPSRRRTSVPYWLLRQQRSRARRGRRYNRRR